MNYVDNGRPADLRGATIGDNVYCAHRARHGVVTATERVKEGTQDLYPAHPGRTLIYIKWTDVDESDPTNGYYNYSD